MKNSDGPYENDAPRLVDAQIRCDRREFQQCDVRDLDMHGVFVLGRDGSLTRLPKNTAADLALKLQGTSINPLSLVNGVS